MALLRKRALLTLTRPFCAKGAFGPPREAWRPVKGPRGPRGKGGQEACLRALEGP